MACTALKGVNIIEMGFTVLRECMGLEPVKSLGYFPSPTLEASKAMLLLIPGRAREGPLKGRSLWQFPHASLSPIRYLMLRR